MTYTNVYDVVGIHGYNLFDGFGVGAGAGIASEIGVNYASQD
jgi:hypothetical protein